MTAVVTVAAVGADGAASYRLRRICIGVSAIRTEKLLEKRRVPGVRHGNAHATAGDGLGRPLGDIESIEVLTD